MRKEDFWKKVLDTHVRNLRILNGWTQRDLAAKLKRRGFSRCSRALLSQIEAGVVTVRGHELYYLRKVFGKSLRERILETIP